ncbi:helix-turn-helix transcriptional regulator [Paenibacillus sp. y28]|uniref:helix-turn-helix transcriptional regulator n=1 Tax=Paenibacillus sp. y28 TaxID=3129110 RepID=UPI003019F13C
MYTLSGSGKLRYAGKTYSLPAGHAFWIDCMEPQYYEGADRDLLWVYFNGAASRAYYEQFVRIGTGPVLPLAADRTVPDCIRELLKLHREKDVRAELLSSQHIIQLLTVLLLSAMGRGDARHPGWMPAYVEQAMNSLEQRYADQWTLDQLAVLCLVSNYHLAREFKKYTGFAPHEYLANLRITAAKQLLVLSDMPVAAISQHVGHTNVSHFISLFKQEEGVTPLAYRKQWHRQGRGGISPAGSFSPPGPAPYFPPSKRIHQR